jgi:type 2 lantibiotic biosynthesis protein LanM
MCFDLSLSEHTCWQYVELLKMKISSEYLRQIVEKASSLSEIINDLPFGFMENNINNINLNIENWCETIADGDWEIFSRRLAWDNLDIKKIKNNRRAEIKNINIPSWAETFRECMEASAEFSLSEIQLETYKLNKNNFSNEQTAFPFEDIFLPFVSVARKKLMTEVGQNYCLISDKAHNSLECSLLGWLCFLSSIPLELEFSAFRYCQQPTIPRLLKKSLISNSKREYEHFIKNMLAGKMLVFFQEYPVLARLLAIVIDSWVNTSKEFLQRLASDWSEIQKIFQEKSELGQVIDVKPDLSDRHNYGRTVMEVSFSCGLKLFYKPRDLGIEKAYNNLLVYLNKHNFTLPFKVFKVFNCLTHGWVEGITPLPCNNKEEVKRYYQRAGALLCLGYVLEATDLHLENLIACGEQPILIDLETLMHPLINENEIELLESDSKSLYQTNQKLWNSVLRTGLLPQWSEKDFVDFSGFGGIENQKSFFKTPKWHYINTDNMILTYEVKESQSSYNRPSLNGEKVELNDYIEDIIDGFRKMYSFFIENRQKIMSLDSPLTEFAHQSIRFIFRPTRIYGLIQDRSLQLKYLRNGVRRSVQLDFLSREMISLEIKPLSWQILKAEIQALEQLDIPVFYTFSDGDILTINYQIILENYFAEPSFNRVIKHINHLNNEDLEYQISLIGYSLYARTVDNIHSFLLSDNLNTIFQVFTSLPKSEITSQVIKLGKKLKKQAIYSKDNSATWIAPQYILKAQKFNLQLMGNGLYEGFCGVTLFLAELGEVSNGTEFRELALSAIQPLRQDLQRFILEQKSYKEIGIVSAGELGSIIYALTCISQFLNKLALLEDVQKFVSLISPDLITADNMFDIISGSAGSILGLLALYNISTDSEILEKAISCGNHLLNNRTTNLGYRTWATVNGKLLTGFSHGAAGIAYALLRLYQATGETRFKEAAEEAIAYERSVFIPELNNWPDFRQPQTKDNPKCMCSWCHGAPGIGLARVATLDILDTPEIRQDIEAAITTTLNYGLSDIDHLCCGNMGRVEFLFTAGRKLNRPELVEAAMKLASQVVARAEEKGHYGYGSILDFHPGFFQGASGIGYQLLRLAYPDQLPSVLLWE